MLCLAWPTGVTASAVRVGQNMPRTRGLIAFIHSHRATLLLLHLLYTCVPLSNTPSHMGRSTTKSVARVYPDVNSKLGSSWYEYGGVKFSAPHAPLALKVE